MAQIAVCTRFIQHKSALELQKIARFDVPIYTINLNAVVYGQIYELGLFFSAHIISIFSPTDLGRKRCHVGSLPAWMAGLGPQKCSVPSAAATPPAHAGPTLQQQGENVHKSINSRVIRTIQVRSKICCVLTSRIRRTQTCPLSGAITG